MNFYLIGTDYRKARIDLREEFYKKRKEIYSSLSRNFEESALFSTCNRIEIYGVSREDFLLPEIPFGWYLISGRANIFRHALRLASGLKSQLKGEREILKQISAWKSTLSPDLLTIWQKAYSEALDIRKQSGLGQEFYNVATLLYKELESFSFGEKDLKVIVVGTGKIAELLAKNKPGNVSLSFVSHKNKKRGQELAAYSRGNLLDFEDLAQALQSAHVLISATASPHYILTKDKVEQATSNRITPLYIYDLGAPRDIEPRVRGINNVFLNNLDDFSAHFEEHNKAIREKLNLAEYLVEERVRIYEESVKAGEPAEQVSLASG